MEPPKRVLDAFLLAVLGNYVEIYYDPDLGYMFECRDTNCSACPYLHHCKEGTYNPTIVEYVLANHPEVLL